MKTVRVVVGAMAVKLMMAKAVAAKAMRAVDMAVKATRTMVMAVKAMMVGAPSMGAIFRVKVPNRPAGGNG